MAVSRVGSWEAFEVDETVGDGGEETDPDDWSGTLSVGAGTNRMLVFLMMCEQSTQLTVSTMTIGGQSASYTGYSYLNASPDQNVLVWIWNEAAIGNMSGTAIVYSDGTTNKKNAWSFATYKDVKQATPLIDSDTVTSGTTFDLTTTSTSDDMIITGVIDAANNRHPIDSDTLTSRLEYHADNRAVDIADGAGGDNTTTITNDGFANSNIAGLSVVLTALSNPIPQIHHHRKQIGAV